MTEQPKHRADCPCCHGKGGHRAATHLDPAEYCDLCYGAGWVTPQRRAAWVAHRVYRAALLEAQARRRYRLDPHAF